MELTLYDFYMEMLNSYLKNEPIDVRKQIIDKYTKIINKYGNTKE